MKLFFNILLFLLCASTLVVCVKAPKLHNKVLVFNSEYKLVQEDIKEPKFEKLPIMEQKFETKMKNVYPKNNDVKKTKVVKQKVENKYEEPKKVLVNNLVQKNKKQDINTQKVKQTQTTKIEQKLEEVVLPKRTPNVLTEEEEMIAWNEWRSNLQNKIMSDVALPIIPNGIIFKFTFRVDKYGKISNVQTWSPDKGYTPYAIQYIAPVIRSYQGKDILDFPTGSNRTVTDFRGGWRIANNIRLSTPQDYNDIEKVKN